MDELFAPPGSVWQRVSPRLTLQRRGVLLVWALIAGAALFVLARMVDLDGRLLSALLVALLLLVGWGWWVIGRAVRRWGYAEDAEELAITRGALLRRLVVVPYGRMQYVDVQSGPIDQLLGIATVQLHTASPGTTAIIPGLPAAEAARLRDRLTEIGESKAAGL